MIESKFTQDNYLDYFAVMEETSPQIPIEIKHEGKGSNNELSFLRFRACLQSFGSRNRNRRLWQAKHMKTMLSQPHVYELLKKSGIPGENGHPIPATGEVSMERIVTIDPNNMSHRIIAFDWVGENYVYGTIETLDEGPGSAGYKMMRNIMQGMQPSFSVRTLVPMRKNADGSTDVTGAGRYITHDRVILPSHSEAYLDESVPIKNIVTKPQFDHVMESFTDIILDRSEKVNRIIDNSNPVMESASIDKNGIFSIKTDEGRLFIAPEKSFRNEISDLLRNM